MSLTDTVGVIGIGKVGQSVVDLLERVYDVKTYDKYKSSDPVVEVICDTDYAVIAVPTPLGEDGEADTSTLEKTVYHFGNKFDHIMIKSTVPPGTTRRLNEEVDATLVMSPEFVGEGSYVVPFWKNYPDPNDMSKHQFRIFGGPRRGTKAWLEIFQKVMGPEPEYYQTDWEAAELMKYMDNSWIATKVTFVNVFFEIAEEFGVDFRELRELWLADGRISRMHSAVFEGDRGYDTKCINKDVPAIIEASKEKGYFPEFLQKVIETNDEIRSVNNEEN